MLLPFKISAESVIKDSFWEKTVNVTFLLLDAYNIKETDAKYVKIVSTTFKVDV